MDPRLNDDEKAWRDHTREAAAPLRAAAAAIDAEDETPRELFDALGSAGMLGACVADQHGGRGGGALQAVLMCEELGAAGAGTAAAVVAHTMACRLIETCDADGAAAELLGELASGAKIAAVLLDGGVSLLEEPAVTIVATRTEEGAVLNGEARDVTGAVGADVLVVPAMDGDELIIAVLEDFADGASVAPTGRKLGLNGSGAGDVALTGAVAMVLDGDAAALDGARDLTRVAGAALCVGIGRAAQEASAQHAKGSEQGLDRSQSVQWMIADQATEIEAARLLTWYAATRADAAELREVGAMARLLAVDAAVGATRRAVQIFGAQGNRSSAGVERLYRDAKAMEVHDGAAEAQRTAVARGLLADLF